MNWRWILMLAALGVVISAMELFGVLPASVWISAGLLLVFAVLLGYNVKQKHFMNGFWTGVIWTFVGGLLTVAFWDTYIANNPEVAQKLEEATAKMEESGVGMDMRYVTLINTVIGAAIMGVVLGLLTLLAGKLLQEKPKPETEIPVNSDQ